MTAYPKTVWEDVRLAYEHTDEPVRDLARRFDVSRRQLHRRARADGWALRNDRGPVALQPPAVVIERLYRTIDLKLAQMEARIMTDDDMSVADHERETRALGQLIRNFEKVTGLEGDQRGAQRQGRDGKSDRDSAADTLDPHQLREQIAERVLRLREKRADGEG